jgi:hypothetical protein
LVEEKRNREGAKAQRGAEKSSLFLVEEEELKVESPKVKKEWARRRHPLFEELFS